MTLEMGSHWQAAEEVDWAWDAAAAADDDDDDEEYPHAAVVSRIKDGTRKRLYERGADELDDREIDKMYKRDYWDDPAHAPLLELTSLGIARAEAVLCFSDRVLRATDAMLAQRRQEREEQRRRGRAADGESESEPAPDHRAAAAAAGDEGRRLFFCFWWRLVVDKIAALLHYFLG